MDFLQQISSFVPSKPREEIDWEGLDPLFAGINFYAMKNTPQNPDFHGEGDVYTHTKLVCEALAGMPAFQPLSPVQKTELFLAALLHDIGKIKTTRIENNTVVSPHHASKGSLMARAFLWKECGLCGTMDHIKIRETVCALIRHHMQPVYLLGQDDPQRTVRSIAAEGELAEDFSWDLLCILSEADIRGRIAKDTAESLFKIQLCRMLAEEAGCLYGPYHFADSFTKHAYLSGRNVHPDEILFDDTRSEVILLSGLPGTGKDTLIRAQFPDLPVVSLDEIRKTQGVGPKDNNGSVIQAAREQAKGYLRAGQPFIWNATNIVKETRNMLCSLMERYGAKPRIIYLETGWEKRQAQNRNRPDSVPEAAVERMLGKTTLPTPEEACTVEWISV